jgi:hypothetical protein
MKSLSFPLMATTMTKKDANHALSPALMAGLPSSGVVRTMPRVVVHGPQKFQGLGIDNLYTLQGIAHTGVLIRHGRNLEHFNGQLLRANVEQAKLEIGKNGPLFAQDFSILSCLLTECWVKHTWKFLSESNMIIEDSLPDIQLRREGDELLVDLLVAAGYRGQDLQRLNKCRLFLQVATSSDITTADGRKIAKTAWDGVVDGTSPSPYMWPNQGKPGASDWNLWQQALRRTFNVHGQRLVRYPLGRWHSDEDQCRWYFETSEERLYEQHSGETWYYPKIAARPTRQTVMRFRHREPAISIPATAQRASVATQGTTIVLTGHQVAIPPAPTAAPTLQQRIANLHEDAQWAIERLNITDEGRTIAEAISASNCIAVSDGSFFPGIGTAAFTVQGLTSEGMMDGECITPGYAEDQSAYRSEASGLYAISVVIWLVCQHYQITEGTVEVGCDGESALLDTMDLYRQLDAKKKHFDLLLATREVMASCPVKWKFRHVYGHQDRDRRDLDRWATLNCDCDERAKAYARFLNQQGIPEDQRQVRIFKEPWPLWIEGRKASSDIGPLIKDQVDGKPLLKYWRKKGKLGTADNSDIDWNGITRAMKTVPLSRQIWVTKQVSTFCGTGVNMKKWGKQDTSNCPRCNIADEDTSHVLKCPAPEAIAVWDTSLAKLAIWMREQQTSDDIIEAICSGLRHWRSNSRPPHQNRLIDVIMEEQGFHGWNEILQGRAERGVRIATLMTQQNIIGWEAFLEGRPATGWMFAQEGHYRSIPGCMKTGRRWITALIKKLWDTAWSLWDHRNKINTDSETSTATQELTRKIQEQFHLGVTQLPRVVKRLFQNGIDGVMSRSTAQQKAWLRRVSVARERAQGRIDEAQENLGPQRQLMRRYFGQ